MDYQDDGFGSVQQRGFPHPIVAFFHVFFRASAILIYLIGSSLFSASFIGIFVTVVLLLSLDFWTVKNVTGRILVGLRWWNCINEAGDSEWIFECRNGDSQNKLSPGEVRLFWISLVLAPAFWILFFLTALFRFNFQWLVLVFIGITLTMSNLLGYLRCKFGNSNSVTNLANDYIRKQMFANMVNLFAAKANTAAGPTPASGQSRPTQFI